MRELTSKMKIIVSVLVVSILILVVFLSSGVWDKEDYSSYITVNSVSDLARNSNKFAFDMYGQLQSDGNNVFFSPYSLTTALAMAYEGARSDTATEMGSVLNLPADNQNRWDLMKSFQSALNTPSSNYELSTANAYWLMKGEDLNSTYQQIIEEYYLAHGEELDFGNDPAGSAHDINDWVEEKTNGKITDLISPNVIGPMTFLILTNAIYFKSEWKYQFSLSDTGDRPFYLSNSRKINTSMMWMNDESIKFQYAENEDAQMLQLPYIGEELSMYIMLPKYGYNISMLENNLNVSYYQSMKNDMSKKTVEILLPKFKMDNSYYLKPPLCELGMSTAFSDMANFTGITESEPLKIGDVIQKSFIEVNEEGTEASASTIVTVVQYGDGDPNHRVFFANHPFIFFIEHEETGQILFMGKVENPSA